MEKIVYYLLSFYTPESHLDSIKSALFDVGAGKQGDYEMACWQCVGQGQFRPMASANPAIGEINSLTYVVEYKVEIRCSLETIRQAVEALKQSHPYEEPAFSVVKMEHF